MLPREARYNSTVLTPVVQKSSDEDKGDDEVSKSNDDDDEENPDDDDDDQDVDDDDDDQDADDDDDQDVDDDDDDDQDADNDDDNNLDNDGDDFVHPKFTTHNDEVRQDEEDKEEECESTDDEAYDEITQGGNDEEEKLDEEKTNEEEEIDETYRDVNINLERSDTEMTNTLLSNIQATHVIKDTHVTVVNPEVQHQSSLYHQTSFPTCSTLIQIQFEDRVKTLENDFSAFKQTNSFAEAVLAIPSIVDNHLANQMNEAVKVVVQL
ncbi:hypothetical protein Tco_0043741 [Tanacetum coccineum]